MKNALLPSVAAVLAAGLLACGEEPSGSTARSDPARTTTVTAEQSAALARNVREANRFVGDGEAALERRLAALKGNPVVVNLWATWCGPCRFEFPFFAAATERHRDRVAFVGLDVSDDLEAAERFVDRVPPGFPSIFDGEGKAAASVGGGRAMPRTLFLGRDGRAAYMRIGGYAKAAELDADIRRYALAAPR